MVNDVGILQIVVFIIGIIGVSISEELYEYYSDLRFWKKFGRVFAIIVVIEIIFQLHRIL